MVKKRVESHVLEKVIGTFMVLFGIASIWILVTAIKNGVMGPEVAMIEILLIVVLAILAQTVVLIKIYEQH